MDITSKDSFEHLPSKQDGILYLFFKRFSDVAISAFALLILFAFILIIAFIIICLSRHNPFYKDERIGKDGKKFFVYKFKTMVEDADVHPEKYLNPEQMSQWLKERKVDNDPRETKFGRILRKTSIDEIPQFVNVLIGNMSIVGCRPITEYEFCKYFTVAEQEIVSLTKPGITGYWQVYNRSSSSWENGDRKKYIFYYLSHRSFWLDTKLFLLTIPSCLIYLIKDKRRER